MFCVTGSEHRDNRARQETAIEKRSHLDNQIERPQGDHSFQEMLSNAKNDNLRLQTPRVETAKITPPKTSSPGKWATRDNGKKLKLYESPAPVGDQWNSQDGSDVLDLSRPSSSAVPTFDFDPSDVQQPSPINMTGFTTHNVLSSESTSNLGATGFVEYQMDYSTQAIASAGGTDQDYVMKNKQQYMDLQSDAPAVKVLDLAILKPAVMEGGFNDNQTNLSGSQVAADTIRLSHPSTISSLQYAISSDDDLTEARNSFSAAYAGQIGHSASAGELRNTRELGESLFDSYQLPSGDQSPSAIKDAEHALSGSATSAQTRNIPEYATMSAVTEIIAVVDSMVEETNSISKPAATTPQKKVNKMAILKTPRSASKASSKSQVAKAPKRSGPMTIPRVSAARAHVDFSVDVPSLIGALDRNSSTFAVQKSAHIPNSQCQLTSPQSGRAIENLKSPSATSAQSASHKQEEQPLSVLAMLDLESSALPQIAQESHNLPNQLANVVDINANADIGISHLSANSNSTMPFHNQSDTSEPGLHGTLNSTIDSLSPHIIVPSFPITDKVSEPLHVAAAEQEPEVEVDALDAQPAVTPSHALGNDSRSDRSIIDDLNPKLQENQGPTTVAKRKFVSSSVGNVINETHITEQVYVDDLAISPNDPDTELRDLSPSISDEVQSKRKNGYKTPKTPSKDRHQTAIDTEAPLQSSSRSTRSSKKDPDEVANTTEVPLIRTSLRRTQPTVPAHGSSKVVEKSSAARSPRQKRGDMALNIADRQGDSLVASEDEADSKRHSRKRLRSDSSPEPEEHQAPLDRRRRRKLEDMETKALVEQTAPKIRVAKAKMGGKPIEETEATEAATATKKSRSRNLKSETPAPEAATRSTRNSGASIAEGIPTKATTAKSLKRKAAVMESLKPETEDSAVSELPEKRATGRATRGKKVGMEVVIEDSRSEPVKKEARSRTKKQEAELENHEVNDVEQITPAKRTRQTKGNLEQPAVASSTDTRSKRAKPRTTSESDAPKTRAKAASRQLSRRISDVSIATKSTARSTRSRK